MEGHSERISQERRSGGIHRCNHDRNRRLLDRGGMVRQSSRGEHEQRRQDGKQPLPAEQRERIGAGANGDGERERFEPVG